MDHRQFASSRILFLTCTIAMFVLCDGQVSEGMPNPQQDASGMTAPYGSETATDGNSLGTPPDGNHGPQNANPGMEPVTNVGDQGGDSQTVAPDSQMDGPTAMPYSDQQPAGSEAGDSTSSPDGFTESLDFDNLPSEEPDKFGEELVASCKAESNYQGDFQDPHESTKELKCFYSCAMVKMDIMYEEDDHLTLSYQAIDYLLTDTFGDNQEMIQRYKDVVAACDQEVPKSADHCEYAFDFINCGIKKLAGRS